MADDPTQPGTGTPPAAGAPTESVPPPPGWQPPAPYGQGYQQPYYPGPMPPSTSYWAIASIICALAGLFIFYPVGPILGVIFGHIARREIRRSGGRVVGDGLALAGLLTSYTALVLGLLVFVLLGPFGPFHAHYPGF
jgi:hypothetical protein